MLMTLKIVLLLIFTITINTDHILLILDNVNIKQTHSQFIDMLQKHHSLNVEYSFGKQKIELKNYDRFIYDHIIVMCTSQTQSKSQIKINDIISYFDGGGNVVLIPDIDTSKSFRKLFYSFGIELDEFGSKIKDNFNNHGSSDIVTTRNYAKSPFIMTQKPLRYRGVGLNLVNFENYQLYELINSQKTAFTRNYLKQQTQRVGSITLAAAIQGLNNARAMVVGSQDFFSNQAFQPQFGNKQATMDLLAWTFRKTGIIRARNMYYHGQGNPNTKQTLFNVGQKIYYQVEIQLKNGQQWVPYSTDDLQVEFVMLDPWVRVPIVQQNSTNVYSAEFYAPGKEGIYQFKIIYKKPGFTFLKEAQRVTVRPYKHDEYQRFLFVAFPYFYGLFGTIVGTFIFIIVFVYSGFKLQKQKSQ